MKTRVTFSETVIMLILCFGFSIIGANQYMTGAYKGEIWIPAGILIGFFLYILFVINYRLDKNQRALEQKLWELEELIKNQNQKKS